MRVAEAEGAWLSAPAPRTEVAMAGGEGGGEGGGAGGGAGGEGGGGVSHASCSMLPTGLHPPALPPHRTTQRWLPSEQVTLTVPI